MYSDSDIYEIARFLLIQEAGFHELPNCRKEYYSSIRKKLKLWDVAYCDWVDLSCPEDFEQFRLLVAMLSSESGETFSGSMHVIKDPELIICDFYPFN